MARDKGSGRSGLGGAGFSTALAGWFALSSLFRSSLFSASSATARVVATLVAVFSLRSEVSAAVARVVAALVAAFSFPSAASAAVARVVAALVAAFSFAHSFFSSSWNARSPEFCFANSRFRCDSAVTCQAMTPGIIISGQTIATTHSQTLVFAGAVGITATGSRSARVPGSPMTSDPGSNSSTPTPPWATATPVKPDAATDPGRTGLRKDRVGAMRRSGLCSPGSGAIAAGVSGFPDRATRTRGSSGACPDGFVRSITTPDVEKRRASLAAGEPATQQRQWH